MLCCPTSSCEKCYTQTRAVPGLSHLTEMAACQLIFQGVACLHTQKPAQNKPLLELSWHRMRGKWGREQTGKGSVLDFLFWRRPYVLLPPCRPLETSTVHVNFGQARRKQGGWVRWRTKLARLDRWGMCGVGRVKSEQAPSADSSVMQASCWPLLGSSRENGHKVELWHLSISEQLNTHRCPECPDPS